MTPSSAWAALLGTAFPGSLSSARLSSGLEVHLLDNPAAPVVTVALTYRAGGADDPAGRAGLAHFLEHMMFKGSAAYGPGEIDRLTRSLGGSNNAFTSHDLTTYHFSFGRREWTRALDIESDRMRGPTLDPDETERERAVIQQEIAMYAAEPWEALDRAVRSAFYGEHPYGRPVAGTMEEVGAIDSADLEAFHRLHYRPENAVLVVAGGVGGGALDEIRRRFDEMPRGNATGCSRPEPKRPDGCHRLRLERGRVARLLCWLPVPAAEHPDVPALRLLATLLAVGRSSRLQGSLVESGGESAWVSVGLDETTAGGALQIASELVPNGSTARVEATLLAELERLRREAVPESELERARSLFLADWIFAHERVEDQAMTLAESASLVSTDYAAEQIAAISDLGAEELVEIARRYLDPERGAVLGWAEPA